MDASVVYGCAIFAVAALLTSAQVITPPSNVTVKRGSWANFTCDTSSQTDIMWARYTPGIEVLYPSAKPQNLSAKYAIEKSTSLVIKDTDLSDGVTYSCMALGLESRPHYANLIVIGNLAAKVDSSNTVSFGDNITMTCSLTYGGPSHDGAVYPLSPDHDPKLSIFLGSEDLTSFASETHIPGSSSNPMHNKSLSLSRILTAEDAKKELRCYVRSYKPVYEDSTNLTLPFRYSPRTVTIEMGGNVTSDKSIYTGQVLNCSADGFPAPQVYWMPVGKNPKYEIVKTEPGYSVLKLIGPGFHNWNCTASNTPGVVSQAYSEINITVIDLPSKAVESKSGSVGLGVGLGIGLGVPIVLGIVILIVFLQKKKQSRNEKPSASQKKSLFGKNTNTSGFEKTNMTYKPQPLSDTRFQALPSNANGINPKTSNERTGDGSQKRLNDNSGHADLGIGTLGASGSMPRLNESFDSADERNFNRDPKSRNHSSYDDEEQFYPSRYHKVTNILNSDTVV